MTTMTMPATASAATTAPRHTERVSHLPPFLVAMALLAASAVIFVLLSGPMH